MRTYIHACCLLCIYKNTCTHLQKPITYSLIYIHMRIQIYRKTLTYLNPYSTSHSCVNKHLYAHKCSHIYTHTQ